MAYTLGVLDEQDRRPFVSCLLGLYGCRWRRRQRSGAGPADCCCSKWEGAYLVLLVAAFCLTLIFLYFWVQAKNDYNDFDWFNFVNMGFWFPWTVVLLVMAAVFFSYTAMLMLLALCLLSHRQTLCLHWLHKMGVTVSLTFAVMATCVMSDLWSQGWSTLLLSFQVTAPYLHVGGVLLMTALAWPVALHFFCVGSTVRRGLILTVYLVFLLVVYLVPLGLYSPCIRPEGTLGPPPGLIAHRGAPMLAPENTLMAFEKAVEAGSDGLETDVTISFDGVPFLMHDRTLERTTDVRQVFPNRTDTSAAMFMWAELQSLNAGAWFLSTDPFNTASSLGKEERLRAGNQSVCSLLDFLQLAARTDKLVIFDLYQPPEGHPYRMSWIQRTLDVIHKESSIRPSQVLWLPPELRCEVVDLYLDLQQTSGTELPLEGLQRMRIVKLNLHYTSMSAESINAYTAMNISTNLYVISEAWLYSLAWCSGVHSVTTNNPQLFHTMRRPLFLMTPAEYNVMWLITDVLSLLLIVTIFAFHRWQKQRVTGAGMLDEGTYSQFKTELSDIWSVSSATKTPNLATSSAQPTWQPSN
ncbi:glycerophosphodiester phosphodiesterase domain-containing protein 5-like isoform X1 [Entelurus aequoreus]|uniref:glycerophosphodiester phosphodiesterase domain-containing protein 5-like isoform X1 n=1 Tax=Entelurus aequoreus TaxID=161455 RepID=UPI002B1DBFCE|nr:glycerophosphodiester phosphodiesterase domain-containing protein 5-like isoform X1 [Entelurus aequoreus]XP_061904977.1 glycerophosphodiester phosphodiesterase domain-containing protein 5-like isoform X1 [Entelurus aequoreus]